MYTRRNGLEILALFLFSLLLFTWGIKDQEIIAFDTRFYLFAQEMVRYGISWFPTALQQPYPDYPGTSTWVIYGFALMLGGLQKLVAVLPTAILAALTVVLTYLIGSLHQKRWGWCAAALLLLTDAFFKSARSLSLDMYPTVITAACFYLLYSAELTSHAARSRWIYPLFVLGFLFRGPIGLVVPTGVACVYYLLEGKIKKAFTIGLLALLLLLICTLGLLLLAYHVGGRDFMHAVLQMEVLGRLNNPYLPRYYYFTNSLTSYALSYPIAILVMLGIFYYVYTAGASKDSQFIFKLFGWMMVILIGMSVPDDKKDRYIMPFSPAIALIAAYPWVAHASQHYFSLLRKLLTVCLFFLPLMVFVGAFVGERVAHRHSLPLHFPMMFMYAFCVLMQAINVAIISVARKTHSGTLLILGTAVVSYAIVMIGAIEPIQLYIDRTRDEVVMVETQRISDKAQLVFYKESPDGLPLKYIINMITTERPTFVHDPVELLAITGPAYFITSANYYMALPQTIAAHFSVVEKIRIGHVPVVVFKRKNSHSQ